MMKSMTGYGKGEVCRDGYKVVVEIRSVNGRFLEVTPRIPRSFARVEDPIAKLISARIARGSVEYMLNVTRPEGSGRSLSIDWDLARQYATLARQLRLEFQYDEDFNIAAMLRAPEVVKLEAATDDNQTLDSMILQAVELAVAALDQMRIVEGRSLSSDLAGTVERFCAQFQLVRQRAPQIIAEYSARLTERIGELVGEMFEPSRVLTEVAVFADRVDINEELARLDSHLAQLNILLAADGEIGKKIDFLIQEIYREVNTIGSKSRDTQVTAAIVAMKSEVERLREQCRNIE